MTINELEKILITENVDRRDYEIRGHDYIGGYDGFIILHGDRWQLYYMERGEKDLLGEFETEHEVCMKFLEYMAMDDKQLAKYLLQAKPA